jgi:hypothetical protein
MKAPGPERTSFGDGVQPRHTTPKAVERRLYRILKPLVESAGGYITTRADIGEPGIDGLALTLGEQQFDLIIREVRP